MDDASSFYGDLQKDRSKKMEAKDKEENTDIRNIAMATLKRSRLLKDLQISPRKSAGKAYSV